MKQVGYWVALAAVLAIPLGCRGDKKKVEDTSGAENVAQTDVQGAQKEAEAALEAQLDLLWDLQMKTFPRWATYEGIRDYDDQLSDASPEGEERYIQQVEAIAKQVEAIDPSNLSPMSQDTRAMVLMRAKQMRVGQVCHSDWWSVDGLGGPQVSYLMMPVFHSIRTEQDLKNLESRYKKTGKQIDQTIANLAEGKKNGYTAVRVNVERAIAQLDALLARPVKEDPMLRIKPANKGDSFDTTALEAAVTDVVRPALTRYRDFLRDEILPVSRDKVGVSALPDGDKCYAARMQGHIGEGYTAEQLHQAGLDELEVLGKGMVEVGKELGLKDPTPQDVIAWIKAQPEHYAKDAPTIVKLNEEVVARASKAMPKVFGIVPKTPVEVHEIEPHRAPDAPAAYYNAPPSAEGDRPGIYYVNTHEPTTRPLYNLEALAFHEAIPGHHLQIAIAKELPDVHIWRRNVGQTAFVEGWALYAEVLADEMKLYSDPLSRFGMYNYQAWRAARLVVDTGIHTMGWTRQQAIDFMTKHTALPENEIANEVDRYIAWPGQALSYMVGRLEIMRLRAEAKERMGDKFQLAEFHDVVLGRGAVPLTLLRQNVTRWSTSAAKETTK